MCTLIICRQVFRFFPLVVAANRDEDYDRPAEPPRIWSGTPRILAPVDPITSGTWWALSEYGVLAAITNRDGYDYSPDTTMKRGELCLMALQDAKNADDALESICVLDGAMFNAFHLLIADRHGKAYVVLGDATKSLEDRLAPDGLFLVTNQGVGPKHSPRAQLIERRLPEVAGFPPRPSTLSRVLDLHETKEGRKDASCVHAPGETYGTRSSTIIRLNTEPATPYWNGKPFWEVWHREKPEGFPNCYGQWVKLDPFPIRD